MASPELQDCGPPHIHLVIVTELLEPVEPSHLVQIGVTAWEVRRFATLADCAREVLHCSTQCTIVYISELSGKHSEFFDEIQGSNCLVTIAQIVDGSEIDAPRERLNDNAVHDELTVECGDDSLDRRYYKISAEPAGSRELTGDASVVIGSVATDASRIVRSSPDLPPLTAMQLSERKLIINTLESTHGHVVKAAKLLGVGHATLYRKIARYCIRRENTRLTLGIKEREDN